MENAEKQIGEFTKGGIPAIVLRGIAKISFIELERLESAKGDHCVGVRGCLDYCRLTGCVKENFHPRKYKVEYDSQCDCEYGSDSKRYCHGVGFGVVTGSN